MSAHPESVVVPSATLSPLAQLRAAVVATMLSMALLGLGYPALVVGLASRLAADEAAGSLIIVDGQVRGSRLVAQPFAEAGHFVGRPQPGPDPFAAAGSNLGPSDPQLAARIAAAVAAYAGREQVPASAVPVDAVTMSGSGFDPDISLANARLQVPRVAAARGLDPAAVAALVERLAEPPLFGVIGVARVNLLDANRALAAMTSAQPPQ